MFQMHKQGLTEVKELIQDHTARKWPRWDGDPAFTAFTQ